MAISADLVISGASQIFTASGAIEDPEIVSDGSVAAYQERIVWVGPASELTSQVQVMDGADVIDASGTVVTPGFIDPHTHVVFAGSRPLEFEWRLQGRPYLDIMADGGGILSTVRAVREAAREDIVEQSLSRVQRMLGFGVTTVEIKSGYGLDLKNELKLLRAIRDLESRIPVRLISTFLGAHAFPPEYAEDREGYVDLLIREMLPAVVEANLASGCDIYIEKGVYDIEQARRILSAARDLGLTLRAHVGQFVDLGGAELASDLGALSVDHVDVISNAGLDALARTGTVAVLLPGACVSLGHPPPRLERFLAAGVRIALATDCNPGTSYTENLPLMAFMAATSMGLPCSAALLAITREAAAALGKEDTLGSIAPGRVADLLVHDVQDYREILYHYGVSHVRDVIIHGRKVPTHE